MTVFKKETLIGLKFSMKVLIILQLSFQVFADIQHSDLFPPGEEEYDFKILDPNTVFGSPYGGFARATRSRLAALPLILPRGSEADDDIVEEYMTVTDGLGRRYVCRTYDQEEVTLRSLKGSLFDQVELREIKNQKEEKKESTDKTDGKYNNNEKSEMMKSETTQISEEDSKRSEIIEAMRSLKGVCTQMHLGWWSYEWCYAQKVRQFHVEITDKNQILMTQITLLGKMKSSVVMTRARLNARKEKRDIEKLKKDRMSKAKYEEAKREMDTEKFMTGFLGSEHAMGVVIEEYVTGDICDETKKARSTTVEYHCCSAESLKSLKPFIILDGKPVRSDIAAIAKVQEPDTCHYHFLICTQLLCEGRAHLYSRGDSSSSNSKSITRQKGVPPANIKPKKENESIRETIDRTLEGICLFSNTNEWWAYEFCHGKHVRQYHEGSIFDAGTGITSRKLESEYYLGYYDVDKSESVERSDEINYIVNVTESLFDGLSARKKSQTTQRGNGAYFYQEYIDGEICDGNDPDVKDKGGISRATTVRFFCGLRYELSNVNEDSTCHYVIDVTIPDLCEHAVFRQPADKKQIIKCLPVDDY